MNISERLRQERERMGLSQAEFGAIGGVKKLAQINYEKGERQPDSAYLAAIAAAGVDVAYVLTGHKQSEIASMAGGISQRLQAAGGPAVATSDSLKQFAGAHPNMAMGQLITGMAIELGALSEIEQILVANHRSASAEGKEAIQTLAAFYAKRPKAARGGK